MLCLYGNKCKYSDNRQNRFNEIDRKRTVTFENQSKEKEIKMYHDVKKENIFIKKKYYYLLCCLNLLKEK